MLITFGYFGQNCVKKKMLDMYVVLGNNACVSVSRNIFFRNNSDPELILTELSEKNEAVKYETFGLTEIFI